MSKGEVERIWLPFVPWLLLSTARCCPRRWRRPALAVQVVFALVVQHLLYSRTGERAQRPQRRGGERRSAPPRG